MKTVQSVCTYCGVGCDIVAEVENGSILKMSADKEGIVSEGRLCIKGKYGYDFLYSPNRVRKPRIRRSFIDKHKESFPEAIRKRLFLLKGYDKDFLECSFELAYDIAAFKLKELTEKHGPKSFAAIGGARTNCESGYLFQKFAREVIGSPHVDNCGRVCHAPSLKGMRMTIGEGAASAPFNDIYDTEFMIVIGSNTTEAHPIVANRIMSQVNKGAGLAVMDIRKIALGKSATYELVLPYESNLLTLNMLAFVILSEGLYNEAFIKSRTRDFDAYKESILNDPYANPDFYFKVPGYESLPELIRKTARDYATKRSMILWGLGITEHLDGSKAVAAICNLALLTGNVGKPGAALMPLRGQNNVQGVCDMGMMPYYNPDYQPPKEIGLMTPQLVDEMLEGRLKMLWNMSEDLAHIHPNQRKVHEALSKLELCIVSDLFPTETTEFADIIFGVKSAYEKEGVYVNAERRLHFAQPIIDSDLPDDWEVINEVAKRMGTDFGFVTQEDVWNDTRKKAPNRFGGASYEKLRANRRDGLQWPVKETGTVRLHETEFRTKDGLGHFTYFPYELRGQVEELISDTRSDFYLSTGRIIDHYNNARQTAECAKLDKRHEEDVILVSLEDADYFDADRRYVMKSAYGESKPLKIKITKNIKKGCLFTTFHHSKSHINFLFGDECDSFVMTARFKSVKVKIEPAEG